ncbi:MAG: TonB-dependent receptor domain-containing protein, partial [Gammaproteobacteria bacterium]
GNFAWHLDGFYRSSRDLRIPGRAVDTEAGQTIANSKGTLENTDAESWSSTVGGSVIQDWGFWGVSVNRLENNYGIPPREETVRIDLRQTRYDMKGEIREPFGWADVLKVRFGYNDYQHVELEDGRIPVTFFNNDGLDSRLELDHHALGFFDYGAFGFQVQARDFDATGEEAFVPSAKIRKLGFFLVEDMEAGDFIFEAGMRVEHQFISPRSLSETRHTPVNASVSVLWQAREDSTISLSFTHAQRAPELQELFADGVHFATMSYERGDHGLAVETTYSFELGLRTGNEWFDAELNLFQNWSPDYISQINTGEYYNLDTDSFQSDCLVEEECLPVFETEQKGARFFGFESRFVLPLTRNESFELDMTLFGDYVRGKFVDGDVPRMPPLRYGLQLDFNREQQLFGSLRLTRAEAQRHHGANENKTDGYFLLDASVEYRFSPGERTDVFFFVKGNNLLDRTVRYSTSFLREFAPEAGRGAEIGIQLRF